MTPYTVLGVPSLLEENQCPHAPSRPSGPTTSAASCARPRCSRPARTTRRARSTTPGCAPSRTRRSRTSCKLQEDVGLRRVTDGEFRRASWHMDFIYELDGVTQADGRHARPVPQRRRRHRVHARRADGRRHGSALAQARSSATHFRFLQRAVTRRTPKLTIPSPSMVHYRGGRAAIDEDRLPRPRRVLGRPRRRLRRRGPARWPTSAARYLQFDDTSLAYLNDPEQREQIGASGRRPRAPARDLHPPHQRGARRPAGGHDGHDAHVPRQLPVVVGGRGRLRLRRRGAVQRPRRRRLLHGVRRRRAPAASSRCASCPRARRRARPRHHQARRARDARTTSSAASRRPRKYVDLDQLCLSPQCGFSSTAEGNALTVEQEAAKLRLVVEVADEVWG